MQKNLQKIWHTQYFEKIQRSVVDDQNVNEISSCCKELSQYYVVPLLNLEDVLIIGWKTNDSNYQKLSKIACL